jgi:hypothetical protein
LNAIEQKDRSLAVRIFGLPLSEEEKDSIDQSVTSNTAAAKTAYDKMLKPILSNARDMKLIATLPQMQNVIAEAFRLPDKKNTSSGSTSTTKRPPPILVKLVSSSIKMAIFKAKSAMPEPNEAEKSAGVRRYHIAEDLTPATFNFLMDIRANSAVERAWTTEGQIRFTLANDRTSYVHKVKSVFDSVEAVIKK